MKKVVKWYISGFYKKPKVGRSDTWTWLHVDEPHMCFIPTMLYLLHNPCCFLIPRGWRSPTTPSLGRRSAACGSTRRPTARPSTSQSRWRPLNERTAVGLRTVCSNTGRWSVTRSDPWSLLLWVWPEDKIMDISDIWWIFGWCKSPRGVHLDVYLITTHTDSFTVILQVSHHPPVSAFYVSNRKDGFCLSGSILAKSKFYGTNMYTTTIWSFWSFLCPPSARPTYYMVYILGNSLSAILDGEARLTFLNRGEDYVMNMPYAHCKGQNASALRDPFHLALTGCKMCELGLCDHWWFIHCLMFMATKTQWSRAMQRSNALKLPAQQNKTVWRFNWSHTCLIPK